MTAMSVAGKSVLVTGATDGIGLQSAIELARLGAQLHLVGRDPSRLNRAADLVTAAGGGRAVATYRADLSSQSAIRSLAAEVQSRVGALDVLLNNAGGAFSERQVSVDGIEMTFALNHLGYFLLSNLLRETIAAAPRGRIVNVASGAHRGVALDFDDLQGERDYNGWRAYQRSKLANILFTYELADRVKADGTTVNCLHPGFVASGFGDESGGVLRWGLALAKRLAAISVAKGAETPVYLCASDEVADVTGCYFEKRKAARPSPQSNHTAARRDLWAISERLTGLMP